MLPAGLANDLTKPLPIGSAVGPITIGMDDVARCAAETAGVALAKITSGRESREPGVISLGSPQIDIEVPTLDIAEFEQF